MSDSARSSIRLPDKDRLLRDDCGRMHHNSAALKGNEVMFGRKKIWLWFGIGLCLGFLIIHPSIMIIARSMAPSETPLGALHDQSISATILRAFSYGMLPWSLGMAVLSGMVAALVAKVNLAQMEKNKLKGAVELAGAACHELNQPMQVLLGYTDIIGRQLPDGDPLRNDLEDIEAQIVRMDQTLKNIRTITQYATQEYLKGVRIIDIHRASGH
jgi:signal transduction histidine kinase